MKRLVAPAFKGKLARLSGEVTQVYHALECALCKTKLERGRFVCAFNENLSSTWNISQQWIHRQ